MECERCYLVHYYGLNDFDEKNQWFRGPVKAITTNDLQKVESHLMISGDGGRFNMTVGKEGVVWKATEFAKADDNKNKSVGNIIEVEGLEKYIQAREGCEEVKGSNRR